jgi:GT2 family glycosyltransferase
MKLGIPTLQCYDLLLLLIESAQAGTESPSEYVIVDNGGGLLDSGAPLPSNARVIVPGRNLGVAASWNLLLDDAGDEPIVISNDDVKLGRRTFEEMRYGLTTNLMVCSGWALFAQAPEITRQVGYYDENFWPAYYEDSDYEVRLARAGIERVWPVTEPVDHAGCWTTTTRLGNPEWLWRGVQNCQGYFMRKWGALPGGVLYDEPFNGKYPPGWRLRK